MHESCFRKQLPVRECTCITIYHTYIFALRWLGLSCQACQWWLAMSTSPSPLHVFQVHVFCTLPRAEVRPHWQKRERLGCVFQMSLIMLYLIHKDYTDTVQICCAHSVPNAPAFKPAFWCTEHLAGSIIIFMWSVPSLVPTLSRWDGSLLTAQNKSNMHFSADGSYHPWLVFMFIMILSYTAI